MSHYHGEREKDLYDRKREEQEKKDDKNIWRDFAEINGMLQDDFFDEVTRTTIALLANTLDKTDNKAIKITVGEYTLMLINNER